MARYVGNGNDRLYANGYHYWDRPWWAFGAWVELWTWAYDNTLYGGGGDDFLEGGNRSDYIDGGDDNDTIWGWEGNDTLSGGNGNDYIDGGQDNDVVYAGSGDDTIYGDRNDWWFNSGNGNDTLYGGDGNDQIYGGAGQDYIEGGNGNDTIYGDRKDWSVEGYGNGNDTLYGEDGNDYIDAGENSDLVSGGNGNDTIYGDRNDWFNPGNGNDTLYGMEGSDYLNGGDGDDIIDGDSWYWVSGSARDTIYGGFGNDRIWGGEDNDFIDGGWGNDTMDGESGDDTIDGGGGTDIIYGGLGNDTFRILKNGVSHIKDFQTGLDKLELSPEIYKVVFSNYLSPEDKGKFTGTSYEDTSSVWGVNRLLLGKVNGTVQYTDLINVTDIDHTKITYDLLGEGAFNKDAKTILVTHGFTSNPGNISSLTKAYKSKYPEANVISVDWSDGAGSNEWDYPRVQGVNTYGVGYQIADFLTGLGVNPKTIELAGHSLGAHISSIAANNYQNTTGVSIGTIIGLDAAGPGYYIWDTTNRLDANDADRVVGIRTNPGGLGWGSPYAKLDIYVKDADGTDLGNSWFDTYAHGAVTDIYAKLLGGSRYQPTSNPSIFGSDFALDDVYNSNLIGSGDIYVTPIA